MTFEFREQSQASAQEGHLFDTEPWLGLLRDGFGCRTFAIHNESNNQTTGVSLFKAGPFRLGYLGFPVGMRLETAERYAELGQCLRSLPSAWKPQCFRIALSGFEEQASLPLRRQPTPETAIVDLPAWSLSSASKNVRRDVSKAQKADLRVVDSDGPNVGGEIFGLYRATIERHKGALRYTQAYFEHLAALAVKLPNLRVMTVTLSGTIAAFLVAGQHAGTGYYLHGGSNPQLRQYRPAALLMNEAITWAQHAGCRRFNFLSSPPGQPSLVKYKEKWGGITRDHWTYTLPLRPSYALFRLAESLYRLTGR